MIKKFLLSGLGVSLLVLSQSAAAITIDLFDCAINDDGTVTSGCAGLDANGLGSLVFTISGAGSHTFDAFFDFEIDQFNNTYYNEYGSANGALAAGQSWEIDEPGWVFGDIYDNFEDSTLDDSNAVPSGLEDDVSFALGWDFALAATETATITLFLDDALGGWGGFYLTQTDDEVLDPATGGIISESVYFWSTLVISGDEVPVPEPGTLWLLGAGLMALGLSRRKITKH